MFGKNVSSVLDLSFKKMSFLYIYDFVWAYSLYKF